MASKLTKDDFYLAVGKISQGINNGIKIETDAKDFLSLHLRILTTSISNKAAERCSQKGEQILKYEDIINVLHGFIEGDVLKFAHAEACRNILLHNSGIKVFKPKKPRTARSDVAAVKDRIIPPIFEKAIRTVMAYTLQMSTLPKFDEGLQLINVNIANIGNLLLVDLCKLIKDKSLLEIDHSHVRECMEKSLPPILQQHCNHAGFTLVEKYQRGELKFDTYLDISKTADRRTTKSTPKKTSMGKIIQEKSVKKRHAIKRPGKKMSKKPAVKRNRSTPKRDKKSLTKSSKKPTKRARKTKPVKKAVQKQKRKPDKEMTERESVKKATKKSRKKISRKAVVKRSTPKRAKKSLTKSSKRPTKRARQIKPVKKAVPKQKRKPDKEMTKRESVKKATKKPRTKISRKLALKRKRSTPKQTKKSSLTKSSKKPTKRARHIKPVKKAVPKQKRKPDKEMTGRKSMKKAKKSKQELDISNGILQILERHQWQCEKDAIEKLNSYLMNVLAEFIEECTVESGLTIAKIQAAAKRWLPPRLARHAIAHAAKSLLLAPYDN